MKLNNQDDEPRDKITRLAVELRALSFPTSPISIELARFAANAFESFLRGEAKTLDSAFSLTPIRGRPRKEVEHADIAQKIFALLIQKKSWKEISDDFSAEGAEVTDERTLRRIWNQCRVAVWADEIDKTWDDEEGGG